MMFVGIDGGGTTTRIFMEHPHEEPQYFEFPISIKVRNAGYAASAEKLKKIIVQTFPDPALADASPIQIAIGLSGMSRVEDQELFRAAIQSELCNARVHIESDATLTLKSVLQEGDEGILLLAGTGSVVFYQPAGHVAHRIGGWGPMLSDEGSGYRIGLRALRHYVNMLDGVFPRDALCDAMDRRMEDMEKSARALTARAETDSTFVAAFARDAFDTSERLKHVQDLIHEELIDLVTLLFPLFFPGVMSGATPYSLFLSGGVAQQQRMIHVIEQAFEQDDVNIQVVNARAPAFKALEIARSLAE